MIALDLDFATREDSVLPEFFSLLAISRNQLSHYVVLALNPVPYIHRPAKLEHRSVPVRTTIQVMTIEFVSICASQFNLELSVFVEAK